MMLQIIESKTDPGVQSINFNPGDFPTFSPTHYNWQGFALLDEYYTSNPSITEGLIKDTMAYKVRRQSRLCSGVILTVSYGLLGGLSQFRCKFPFGESGMHFSSDGAAITIHGSDDSLPPASGTVVVPGGIKFESFEEGKWGFQVRVPEVDLPNIILRIAYGESKTEIGWRK